MAEERPQRRLAAILAADVVGYSRLMEVDEAGTLAALKSRRRDVLGPLVAKHQGRIFKTTGDGVLVEFASAVNAVQCAVDLQHTMSIANSDQPEGSHIVLRIGVNLGDVMVEGSDLYGEGVNIAARLEGIADPGGILVSGTAYDHTKNKTKVSFDDLGVQTLKNIAEPVRVFRVSGTPAVAMAEPKLNTDTDKLSIAILPLVNISSDAEQEYFADGLTEDIITELSRFKSLFVIARNSTFRYKGRSIKVQDVGRELGVRWAVEGSVRKLGGRVRVTVQLIDTATGAHVWAERYDRSLENIFDVQDEVVRAIASAIPGHIGRAASDYARRKPPANLTAFDYLLKGRWYSYQSGVSSDPSIESLSKAIEADPNYALAHALLACGYVFRIYVMPTDPEAAIVRALHHATRAVELADTDSEVQGVAAAAYIMCGDHARADFHSRRAIELNPNDAIALNERGLVLTYLGRHSEAMDFYGRALKLDPSIRWANTAMIDCLFMQGRYEELLDMVRRSTDAPVFTKLVEAAAHALLGQVDESHAAMEAFKAIAEPKADPKVWMKYAMRMLARQEDRDRWMEGYRMAGLNV